MGPDIDEEVFNVSVFKQTLSLPAQSRFPKHHMSNADDWLPCTDLRLFLPHLSPAPRPPLPHFAAGRGQVSNYR